MSSVQRGLFGLTLLSVGMLPARGAQAYGSYSGGGMDSIERSHFLSVAGGVASPSMTSAISENPAGLVYNYQLKLLGAVGASSSTFSPMGYSGTLFAGNGTVGAGIGVQTFNGGGATPGQFGLLQYGLAADIQSMDLAIGVGGTYGLWNNGQIGVGSGSWGLNLGMLFNSRGPFRVGATAYNVTGGVSALGFGIAGDISQYATLAADASVTSQFSGLTVKPGLSIYLGELQLTASYGIAVDQAVSSWLNRGGTLGLGFKLGRSVGLQAYYNELSLYYAGLNVNF